MTAYLVDINPGCESNLRECGEILYASALLGNFAIIESTLSQSNLEELGYFKSVEEGTSFKALKEDLKLRESVSSREDSNLRNRVSSVIGAKQNVNSNSVGSAIGTIGVIIFIVGLISALVIGVSDDFPSSFKSTVVLFILISSATQCALFYGFSEVIQLLHEIRNKNNV